jgi:molecular chaperone IbpA
LNDRKPFPNDHSPGAADGPGDKETGPTWKVGHVNPYCSLESKMRVFDTNPLMRSAVGFDNLVRMLDGAARLNGDGGYPPYDIEKVGDDNYRVTMAVAGFTEDELDVTVKDDVLVISGRAQKAEPAEGEAETAQPVYLHRGIAKRAFERRFHLADTIKVTAASLENGLLHVSLVREVPEERKPRQIPINGTGAKVIDHAAAA